MKIDLLDVVALTRDIPEHQLSTDDVGTVVELYDDRGVEVEFVTADGNTRAVLTLDVDDVRKVAPDEVLSVRAVHK